MSSSFDLGKYEFKTPTNLIKGESSSTEDDDEEEISWSTTPKKNWSDWVIIISRKEQPEEDKQPLTNEEDKQPLTNEEGKPPLSNEEDKQPLTNEEDKQPLTNEEDKLSTNEDENGDDSSAKKNPKTTYYVHKSHLAYGKRRSDYFKRLFAQTNQTMQTEEMLSNTSEIVLDHESAFEAFPSFLDFLYGKETKIVTSPTAIALRFLSNYFGVKELFQDVNAFIQSDLNPDNAALYLSEAVCYDDDKIREVALKLIGEHIDTLDGSTLMQLSPDCFQDALSFGVKQKQDHDDCALSALVAQYCTTHQSYIDRDYLTSLTDHFTQIDPQSALSLLNLLQDLQQPDNGTSSSSPLYQKCIRAITSQWKHVLIQPSSKEKQDLNFFDLYQSLSTNAKIDLLESAMLSVAATLQDDLDEKSMQSSHCHHPEQQKQQQNEIVAKTAHDPKDLTKHFYRVMSLDPKNLTECRYAEDQGRLVNEPSSFPRGHPSKGWNLTEGDGKRWPLFCFKDDGTGSSRAYSGSRRGRGGGRRSYQRR